MPPRDTPLPWFRTQWRIALVGIAWAALSWQLSQDGHSPSGPSPFGDDHYAVQTFLVLPTLLLGSLIFGSVSHRYLRPADTSAWKAAAAHTYATSLGAGWVLPDIVVYTAHGFAGLGSIALWLPLASTLIVLTKGAWFGWRLSSRSRPGVVLILLAAWCLSAIPLLTVVR